MAELEQLEHHSQSNVLLPPAPIKFAMLQLRSTQMLCMKHNRRSISGNWKCTVRRECCCCLRPSCSLLPFTNPAFYVNLLLRVLFVFDRCLIRHNNRFKISCGAISHVGYLWFEKSILINHFLIKKQKGSINRGQPGFFVFSSLSTFLCLPPFFTLTTHPEVGLYYYLVSSVRSAVLRLTCSKTEMSAL